MEILPYFVMVVIFFFFLSIFHKYVSLKKDYRMKDPLKICKNQLCSRERHRRSTRHPVSVTHSVLNLIFFFLLSCDFDDKLLKDESPWKTPKKL